MVSGLRAEDVKEALAVYADSLIEFYDQTGLEKKHFRTLIAAARAWLASQEQTPDYEAAADWLRRVGLAGVVTDADIEGGFLAMAEEIIRAALRRGGEVR